MSMAQEKDKKKKDQKGSRIKKGDQDQERHIFKMTR